MSLEKCITDGCTQLAAPKKRSLCSPHYYQWWISQGDNRQRQRKQQLDSYHAKTPEQKRRESQAQYKADTANGRYANPKHGFRASRQTAKQRGLPWTLTVEDYIRITDLPCHYCGGASRRLSGGLDRISNDKHKGYTTENVLPCCPTCNRIRGPNLTVEEMKAAMTAVLELRARKSQGTS